MSSNSSINSADHHHDQSGKKNSSSSSSSVMKLFGFALPYGDHDLDHDHHNKLSFEWPYCGKDFSGPQALGGGHQNAHKAERKVAKRVQIIQTRPSNPPPAPSPNNRHHHHHRHDQGFAVGVRATIIAAHHALIRPSRPLKAHFGGPKYSVGLAARFQRVSPLPVSAAGASHFATIGSSSGPSSIIHYGPIRARTVSHHVGGGVLMGTDRVITRARPAPYAVIRGQGSGGDQDHDHHHDHIDLQLRLAPSNSNQSSICK